MSEYQRALSTMGDSGAAWIDWLFRWCVVALVDVAHFLGISYEGAERLFVCLFDAVGTSLFISFKHISIEEALP